MIDAQILEGDPVDPWGHPYRYWVVRGEPFFVSLGADDACGGVGPALDIVPGLDPLPGECEWRSR